MRLRFGIARLAAPAMLFATRFSLGTEARTARPEQPASVPVEQRGLAVGQKVPEFRVNDQFGHPRDLESLLGPNGLVLLFVRSADW